MLGFRDGAMLIFQEEDFIAYMFGFQDSSGLADIPSAVAETTLAEEQLSANRQSPHSSDTHQNGVSGVLVTALLARLRFRRNLLNVSTSAFSILW